MVATLEAVLEAVDEVSTARLEELAIVMGQGGTAAALAVAGPVEEIAYVAMLAVLLPRWGGTPATLLQAALEHLDGYDGLGD